MTLVGKDFLLTKFMRIRIIRILLVYGLMMVLMVTIINGGWNEQMVFLKN